MPLTRARCEQCSQPLADPPYVPIDLSCVACGRANRLPFAADGQPADFNAAFGASRLMRWFAAARMSMAGGVPGVAVGACASCDWPLVVSSRAHIQLACPHCRAPVQGAAEEVLVDQWCEPWAHLEGAASAVEYRLAWVDDSTGVTAGCAHCATPTAADDDSMHCRHCGAIAWVRRSAPLGSHAPGPSSRQQLGVRADGTRGNLPYRALLPIVQAEHALRADIAASGANAGSGSRTMGVLGIGCAIAAALIGAAILVGVIVAKIAK